MLKTHTNHSSTIMLISAAALLIVALGAITMIKLTPSAAQLSVQPVNRFALKVAPALASANLSLPVSNSVYISEQTLRTRIDDAIEQHKSELAQWLMNILNGRYEHRCCGLPY